MYVPSLSLCPRPPASLCNLVQHCTMWYRPWKFNPHLVPNKITHRSGFKWCQVRCTGGWTVVISTPPLFSIAFSLSHLLSADCDVGLGDNKWLGVSRCHVKPGKGHVPPFDCQGGLVLQGLGFWVQTVCAEKPDYSLASQSKEIILKTDFFSSLKSTSMFSCTDSGL